MKSYQAIAKYRCALKCFLSVKVPAICLFLVLNSISIHAQDEREDLKDIQDLIAQTKSQLASNLESSERIQQELKLAELEIAEAATKLNRTDQSLLKVNRDIKALRQEKTQTENLIEQQQTYLANQLKSAYMAGSYDYAKLLFNQDKAGTLERVLTYYQYLNKARQNQIDDFKGLIATLDKVRTELSAKQVNLEALKQTQVSQSKELRDKQQTRFQKLAVLNKQIESDQARVKRLEQQEKDLLSAIERAELAAKRAQASSNVDIDLSGLTKLKGQLMLPTPGKIERLFGKRRQGQVRWKGVVFQTTAGTPVSAVAEGQVLYADWLKGFGLVVIVDHGDGYMSVYGRNQAVLKNVGDVVRAGDTISLVGTSGGQTRASLYFELRHKGKALNPSQWLRRS
ncbi:murein hydrolase activator EnvC family protein [Agaribacter flavus]|uniref:Murein hydrolase activator EnvC family protein n=1 Tax=Agaribacter flavus TaxID=1902781 RepID=A0ABV7FST9_9ALTE